MLERPAGFVMGRLVIEATCGTFFSTNSMGTAGDVDNYDAESSRRASPVGVLWKKSPTQTCAGLVNEFPTEWLGLVNDEIIEKNIRPAFIKCTHDHTNRAAG